MKKQKMLITLAGLVVAVATTATVAAYTLAGDGSDTPVGESQGTEEPGFLDDKLPTFNLGPGQVSDDGSVFVDNPDTGGGAIGIPDPSGTWPKDNPPTDDITDTPPLHGDPPPPVGRPQQKPVDGNVVPDIAPDIEPVDLPKVPVDEYAQVLELAKLDLADLLGLADTDHIRLAKIGRVEWGNTSLGNHQPGMMYAEVIVPGFKMLLEANLSFYTYHTSLEEAVFVEGIAYSQPNVLVSDDESGEVFEVVPVTTPKEDVQTPDDQLVRIGRGTVELMDPLLATGAQVKVTGEVVSEGIFSVDGRVFEVNGERVQVMDYGDANALNVEAAGISPDGSSVATHGQASMVLWVAPPHFFRTDTAIVLYVGDNSEVIEALTSVMGPQFAGR